ncbi:ribosomal protein subunit L37 [Diplocarpon rosae]|nr:ribosomal protein subunit L37 [Diplocarpon rosae]
MMICARCLPRASASIRVSSTLPIFKTLRAFTSSSCLSTATPPPPATSTNAAQLFSTPLTPPPSTVAKPEKPKSKFVPPVSSVPAGTPLKGLNYMKGRDDPVALPEEDYPEWLWGVLDKRVGEGEGADGEGDEFSKSAKLRRKAAKRARKLEAMRRAAGLAAPEIKVPLTKQSIDLPFNEDATLHGALYADSKRQELRGAMRRERRKSIKESNYLKGM